MFNSLFSYSLTPAALIEPPQVWWLGVLLMGFSVALALTVPDPRKIRLQRERQA